MLRKMKFKLLSSVATIASLVGVVSVEPASLLLWHQPEVPEHLKDS